MSNPNDPEPLASLGDHVPLSRKRKDISKTPAYQALHVARYKRQEIVRSIQGQTGRSLICYVGGPGSSISRDDVVPFADLLHNVDRYQPLDLLLHTTGGDADAAEKLISMLRTHVGFAELRILVPDAAKSAGTLMALGADRIWMSDTSELGPIDPQITLRDADGNRILYPLQSYLAAFDHYSQLLKSDPTDEVAKVMLAKFEPTKVQLFKTTKLRVLRFAERQLSEGMFRPPLTANVTAIAGKLMDAVAWQSHAQMIGPEQARTIGLTVDYQDPESECWKLIWQLYCYQRFEVKEKQKLFESSFVCLTIDDAG